MIACARRCCLCHQFAGVKMECHHIRPQAKGLDNSFENCIPLCLICHAEVGHYSVEHPRGTKFTESELRGHRDRWYGAVRDGKMSGAPADYLELDRKLFSRCVSILGGSGAMTHFRDHDYGAPFLPDRVEGIDCLLRMRKRPEFEFFDLQMEGALSDLCSSAFNHNVSSTNRLFLTSSGLFHIPSEWRHKDERSSRRWDEAQEVMNEAASNVWEAYCRFIKTARAVLRVDPEECGP